MDQGVEDRTLIGVFTTDTGFVVQVWDDAMRSMTGVDPEEAIGRHLTDLIPDLENRGLLSRFERARDLGTNEILAPAFHRYLLRCATRHPSLHFSEMQQLVTITPLRKDDGIFGVMVMVEDVTERLEGDLELAASLKDPDDHVRLEAAKAISKQSGPLSAQSTDAIIGALGDRNWRVRRKLVKGLSKRIAPETIGALLTAFRDGHLDFGLLNSALKVLQTVSTDTAESLVRFLHSEDSDLRIQSALALGEMNNATIVPYLLEALDDHDANVRYHAIEALGKLKAGDAVEALLSIVETRDFFLTFPALESLAKIRGDGIAGRVLPLLDDEDLSESACLTLGATGGIEIVRPIVARLDEGRLSALTAAASLCSLFDRHYPGPLAADIADSVEQSIGSAGKRAVAEALKSASGPSAPDLIRMAGWIDDPEIREGLAALIGDDELGDEVVTALIAHGESAIDSFVQALTSEDGSVRAAAARALGAFESPTAVSALISALSSDEHTAAMAAQSLGRSSSPFAFDALVELLSTDSNKVQQHAVQALKSISRSEMSLRLCSLMEQRTEPKVREALIRIMGGLNTSECVATVVAACEDEDAFVRSAAVEQLPNFQIDNALPLFEKALKDGDTRVRTAAARALGHVNDPGAARVLRSALGDHDAWTRYFAVRSLAALNDLGSEELLRTMSEQDDAEQVRAAAAEAISGR